MIKFILTVVIAVILSAFIYSWLDDSAEILTGAKNATTQAQKLNQEATKNETEVIIVKPLPEFPVVDGVQQSEAERDQPVSKQGDNLEPDYNLEDEPHYEDYYPESEGVIRESEASWQGGTQPCPVIMPAECGLFLCECDTLLGVWGIVGEE